MTRESTRISLINRVSLPFVVLFQFQHSLIRFKMAEIDAIFYDVTNKSPTASWKINRALESNPVSVKNVFKYNSADTQSRLSL